MTPTPNQYFEGKLVLPSGPPVPNINKNHKSVDMSGEDINKPQESRISRKLTKNKSGSSPSGGERTPPSSPAQKDWQYEFVALTANLLGERVTLDNQTGSHFKPGQMYEIMEGIRFFISQTLASERKRIRGEIKKDKIKIPEMVNSDPGTLAAVSFDRGYNKALDQVLKLLSDTAAKIGKGK